MNGRESALDGLISKKEFPRVALSSIGDAVIAADRDGQVTFLNPAAETLTGWTNAEAIGVPVSDVFKIMDEADRQPMEQPAVRALREDKAVGLPSHAVLVRKDGTEVAVADSTAPIHDANGDTIGVVLVFRDVAEQRQAEIELRDAKEYAENVIATVRNALLVLDGSLRVQTANRSFYRTFQVSPSETEGRLIQELGNGQWDIPGLRDLLNQILAQDRSLDDFEVEHDFPGIGRRVMKLNARRMYRERNHSELILLAIEDATQQRNAEEERREAETRFTSLVKNIKDHSIFTLDRSGCITSWNVEAKNILGYSEQEAVGQHFSLIFTPDDVRRDVPQRELDTAKAVGRAEDERWHQRKNGELFWALGIVTPTMDQHGNHNGYSKILRDITERKRAEDRLRGQTRQLRLLWDSASVLLSHSDPTQLMQRIFKKVREQLDVDAFFHFILDESNQRLQLAAFGGISDEDAASVRHLALDEGICGAVALDAKPIIATNIQQCVDPKTEFVKGYGIRAYACHPLIHGDQLIGTLSFASRRIDEFTEEEMAFFQTLSHYVTTAYVRLRLVEDLHLAQRRKDEFLAMLAHELRNPLAPIRSGLDILAMDATEHKETVELMQDQMSHVVRLVDDLMDISRIVRGKITLRRRPVELAFLIRQSVAALRPMVDSRQQQLLVSVPDQELLLHADPVRCAQILENLLHNASKYTDVGGRLELTAERRNGTATIRVHDNGVGIADDLLPEIFDLFRQSSRSLDRSQGGLGIGLTLVKNLTELHGGKVSAHSDGPGTGSTFTVEFPIANDEAVTEWKRAAPEPRRHCCILVVDDNMDAARLLAMLLRKLGGHQVEVAHDGRSALTKFRAHQPEIVLLDIGLPGLDGYDVAREMRKMRRAQDVLLVAVTGYGQADDRQRANEAGFDEHVVKPPSVDQVKAILAHPKIARPDETAGGSRKPIPRLSSSTDHADSQGDEYATEEREKVSTSNLRQAKHDIHNTIHVLRLLEQILASDSPDMASLQALRQGLRHEVEHLVQLARRFDAWSSEDDKGAPAVG